MQVRDAFAAVFAVVDDDAETCLVDIAFLGDFDSGEEQCA
jgi:hypothetical protein